MEVHVVTSDKQSFRVKFSEPAAGVEFIITIALPVVEKWKMQTNQLLSTATILADEILMSHDQAQPLKPEYLFTLENTQDSLDSTIEQIRTGAI